MSRLARGIVRAGSAVIPDRAARARYREQWLADVDGAAEVGIAPARIALGAAVAAVRLAAAHPLHQLPGVSLGKRRYFGAVQLAMAVPYLWAVVIFGYAMVRLDLTPAEVLTPYHHDPMGLFGWPPLVVLHGVCMVWLGLHGWVVAILLAPGGLLLARGVRGSARWLPLAGTLAAAAATVLALSDFGQALRVWMLD